MNGSKKAVEKQKRRLQLARRENAVPVIVFSGVRMLAISVLIALCLVQVVAFAHYEIHNNEYWQLYIFAVPLTAGFQVLACIPILLDESLCFLEIVFSILAIAIKGERKKEKFIHIFSVIALVNIIGDGLLCIPYYYIYMLVLRQDENDLLGDVLGLRNPQALFTVYDIVLLVFIILSVAMYIVTAVRVRKQIRLSSLAKNAMRNDVSADLTDALNGGTSGGFADRTSKTADQTINIKEIREKKKKKLAGWALVTGIVSASVWTILGIILFVLNMWKRHPELLLTVFAVLLPIAVLVLSILALTVGKARGNKKDKGKVIASLSLMLYSLIPAVWMVLLVLLCCLRLFFRNTHLSEKDSVLFALEDRYHEKFIMVSDEFVAPKEDPELVFSGEDASKIWRNGNYYYRAYMARLVQNQIREDLGELYPNAFLYIDTIYVPYEEGYDFKNTGLQDNLKIMDRNKIMSGEYYFEVTVFLDKNKGSTGKYEDEYQYFTETLSNMAKNGEMLRCRNVEYYWVDEGTIERAKEFVKKKPFAVGDDLDREVWGFEQDWRSRDYETGEIGNPPCVNARFVPDDKADVIKKQEFIYRRKLLESK